MNEEEKQMKIRQIQMDSEQLERIRRDLIMNGYALDGPEVRYMDDLLWKQIFRIYALTAGKAAAKKLLYELEEINKN
jgi:aspartyl-tRNA synthetase